MSATFDPEVQHAALFDRLKFSLARDIKLFSRRQQDLDSISITDQTAALFCVALGGTAVHDELGFPPKWILKSEIAIVVANPTAKDNGIAPEKLLHGYVAKVQAALAAQKTEFPISDPGTDLGDANVHHVWLSDYQLHEHPTAKLLAVSMTVEMLVVPQ